MKEACFLLLSVTDATTARAWLAAAPVTTVQHLERRITTALHVALTAAGMRALGVAEGVISGFSAEFITGMAGPKPHRLFTEYPARARLVDLFGPWFRSRR